MQANEPIERIGPYVYRHFAPPELAAQQRCSVAIVGGGPVGLATALGLARQGVSSVVIEADDSVCVGSRAACISRRSLEIAGRLGALPEMLERGLPWSGGRSFWQSSEVFRFAMPQYDGQRLPPMINLQQYYVEDALLAAVARVNDAAPGTIDIRWATTVDALETSADGVTLGLGNALGRGTLRAAWVVACDGGQSFVRNSLGLVVNPDFPAKTFKEFMAYVRANPGSVSYASPGNGSPHHLAMEMFKNRTKTFLVHIPYRGAAPAMQDVMGGQVPVMFLDLASGLTIMQSGKVRVLAFGGAARTPLLPGVPTLIEENVREVEVFAFQGLLGPANMPAATVQRLNAELNKALANTTVLKRFLDFGMEPMPGTPEQFRAFARSESKRWGPIIRDNGITLD